MRQTLDPRTAGAWHCSPLLFDRARHLNAWCIGKCMGLFLRFFVRPYPRHRGANVADNGLPALGDMDVLDRHLLLALRAVVLEGLDLSGERAGQFVECALSAVLLLDIFDSRQASSHRHARGMNGRHLGGEHRLDLVAGLDALHHGQ